MRADMSECTVTYVHEHVKVETKRKWKCAIHNTKSLSFTFNHHHHLHLILLRRRSVYCIFMFQSLLNSCVYVCMCQSLMGKFIFNALCIWDCFVSSHHHHRRRLRHFWEVLLVSRYCELLLMCSVSAHCMYDCIMFNSQMDCCLSSFSQTDPQKQRHRVVWNTNIYLAKIGNVSITEVRSSSTFNFNWNDSWFNHSLMLIYLCVCWILFSQLLYFI